MSEAPAILYDLVLAVGEWHAAGKRLDMPKRVADASKRYLDTQDVLIEWMDACCEKDRDGAVTKQRVELPLATWYWSFLKQSERANTDSLYQHFGEMLVSKGFEKRVAYDGKRYTGPALTVEALAIAEDAAQRAYEEAYRRKHERG